MANHLDLAVTAWAPLAGGALTGKYLNQNGSPKRLKEGSKRLNDKSVAIAQEVVKIAGENNCAPAHVALKWVMQKHPQVFPVIGARSAAQIAESIACMNTTLSDEQMTRLNQVSAFDIGFPHDFLAGEGVRQVLFGGFQDKTFNHRKK
jgi:aryl-alcohol dehydrogenase-like predicted oxidoreductase